jgi:hypothetical protein
MTRFPQFSNTYRFSRRLTVLMMYKLAYGLIPTIVSVQYALQAVEKALVIQTSLLTQ